MYVCLHSLSFCALYCPFPPSHRPFPLSKQKLMTFCTFLRPSAQNSKNGLDDAASYPGQGRIIPHLPLYPPRQRRCASSRHQGPTFRGKHRRTNGFLSRSYRSRRTPQSRIRLLREAGGRNDVVDWDRGEIFGRFLCGRYCVWERLGEAYQVRKVWRGWRES